jgi:hypothetical protein
LKPRGKPTIDLDEFQCAIEGDSFGADVAAHFLDTEIGERSPPWAATGMIAKNFVEKFFDKPAFFMFLARARMNETMSNQCLGQSCATAMPIAWKRGHVVPGNVGGGF